MRALVLTLLAVRLWTHARGDTGPPVDSAWIDSNADMLRSEMAGHRFGFIVGNMHSGFFFTSFAIIAASPSSSFHKMHHRH